MMLINDEVVLKDVLGGIQKKTTWATWKPFVRSAELDHIIPAIGQALYDDLTDKMSRSALNAVEKQLLERLQITLGQFVEMESELAVMLQKGDTGIAVASPTGMQAPGKWAIVARIREARDKADRNLERLLLFLETQVDQFPVWQNSSAFTQTHALFLSSATEYTQYFGAMQESRRLYVILRPYVQRSETAVLEPLLGRPFLTYLRAKLLGRPASFTDSEETVLRHVRTIIAADAFGRALPYINLNTELRIVSETDGIQNEEGLSGERRSEMKAAVDSDVAREVGLLKRYLNENASATVFTPYFQSDSYTPRQKKQIILPANDDPQKPFVL
jgi:hypothetical protein